MNKKQYTGLGSTSTMINFLNGKELDLCIEIGVFEGKTSNLIANHLSETGKLICIDPLEDTYITEEVDDLADKYNKSKWKYFNGQYERFLNNTGELISSKKIELIRKTSEKAFQEIKHLKNKVDFCFIDGDHRTNAVLMDGEGCLNLCKEGGFILFDDYGWGRNDGNFDCGKGIDMFLQKEKDKIEIISKSTQVLVRKK